MSILTYSSITSFQTRVIVLFSCLPWLLSVFGGYFVRCSINLLKHTDTMRKTNLCDNTALIKMLFNNKGLVSHRLGKRFNYNYPQLKHRFIDVADAKRRSHVSHGCLLWRTWSHERHRWRRATCRKDQGYLLATHWNYEEKIAQNIQVYILCIF